MSFGWESAEVEPTGKCINEMSSFGRRFGFTFETDWDQNQRRADADGVDDNHMNAVWFRMMDGVQCSENNEIA